MFKEGAKGLGIFLISALAIMLVVGIIGAVNWIGGVATSGIKGQGEAIKTNNSAENWTAKQAWFEQKYEGIKAYDTKIENYTEQLKTDKDRTIRDTLNGVTSACESAVGEYNAESRSFLSQDWRAADLPAKIDTTDPATDCK